MSDRSFRCLRQLVCMLNSPHVHKPQRHPDYTVVRFVVLLASREVRVGLVSMGPPCQILSAVGQIIPEPQRFHTDVLDLVYNFQHHQLRIQAALLALLCSVSALPGRLERVLRAAVAMLSVTTCHARRRERTGRRGETTLHKVVMGFMWNGGHISGDIDNA
jgi:hypothetical protein